MHVLLTFIFLAILACIGFCVVMVTLLQEIVQRLKTFSVATATVSTTALPKVANTSNNAVFAEQARRTIATNRKRKTT